MPRYGPYWLIETTTDVAPAQRDQLRQPWTIKFDSSWCLFWANGWDPSQLNQGPKCFPSEDKITLSPSLSTVKAWEKKDVTTSLSATSSTTSSYPKCQLASSTLGTTVVSSSLSHFCKILLLSLMNDSSHHSS
jgi:hypothetical protein